MEILSNLHLNIWILQIIAMMITALLIPGFTVSGPIGALLGVVGLAFVNAHLWDAALFFSIPDSLTSQALVTFFANGLIFWVLVKILPGIEVKGLLPALLAPVVFSVTSMLLYTYCKDVDWIELGKKGWSYTQSVRNNLKDTPPSTPKPAH